MQRQLCSINIKGCADALAKVLGTRFASWRDIPSVNTQWMHSSVELVSLLSIRTYSDGSLERTRSDHVSTRDLDVKFASPLLEATIRRGSESLTPGRQQRVPPPPWTPTSKLKKRKFLPRRMGFLMQELEREEEEKAAAARSFPEFNAGDVIELRLVVPENRRREATFRGVCIAKRNRGWRTSFTLLNSIPGGGPVERTFPLYSPHIAAFRVLEHRQVRRSKLYYLRDRNPKEYRV